MNMVIKEKPLPKVKQWRKKKYYLFDTQYSTENASLSVNIYSKRFPKASFIWAWGTQNGKRVIGIYSTIKQGK
jgi:hypothetical protein